jgi:hypothetical protein
MSWRWRLWSRNIRSDDDAAAAREQLAKLRRAQRETPWFEEFGPALAHCAGPEVFVERVRAALSLSKRPTKTEEP